MANSPPGSAPAAADPGADRPVTGAEFAGLLAPLGLWTADRRVAVAVSGGADSLCLALLAHGWGDARAIIVDHGLRAGSAGEAAWTHAALRARGMPSRVVTLRGLRAGPGSPARAREARYAALAAACREAGVVDLLVGHHAGDQAETVLMRSRAGSGRAGLAGMAASVALASTRVLRPLLAVPASRLRATLRQLGQDWVEDPSNADPASTRTRLRAELAAAACEIVPQPGRTAAERAVAAELAAIATIHCEGFAVVAAGSLSPAALGALLRALAGRRYLPAAGAVAALASRLRPATLAGVQVLPAGRLGPGSLLVREAAAMAAAVALQTGAVWDGRFRAAAIGAQDAAAGFTLGPLGVEAARFCADSMWPAAVLRTLPAIRRNNVLFAVPHLAYGSNIVDPQRFRIQRAGAPVCAAPFVSI